MIRSCARGLPPRRAGRVPGPNIEGDAKPSPFGTPCLGWGCAGWSTRPGCASGDARWRPCAAGARHARRKRLVQELKAVGAVPRQCVAVPGGRAHRQVMVQAADHVGAPVGPLDPSRWPKRALAKGEVQSSRRTANFVRNSDISRAINRTSLSIFICTSNFHSKFDRQSSIDEQRIKLHDSFSFRGSTDKVQALQAILRVLYRCIILY